MRAITLILGTFVALASASSEKKVVCYFGSWSVYRPGNGKFEVSNINAKLCTHLIYSFVGLSLNGEVVHLDPWNDLPDGGGKNNLNNFCQLRSQSPNTKLMVAMGGWNVGSTTFSQVVASANLRRKMIDSIVQFLKKYDLDGFDLDWEYPAQRGGSPADKHNLVLLLKELRATFDQESFILSAAVAAIESSASISYDIAAVSKYLHFVNLMVYDLHGSWESKTGINAPLYPGSWESGNEAILNVDAIIKYWLSQGATAEKLNLGVPFYGKGFTLSNPQSHGIGASCSGASTAGPYTREPGMLGYNEICEKVKNENWQVVFNEEQRVPHAFSGNQWVGYDDKRSLKDKANYVKKHGLGGAMVWSIEIDDFLGVCGEKYPLLNTLNRELRSGVSSENNVPQYPKLPQTPSEDDQHQQEPQQPSSSGKLCQKEGYVADPADRSKFYYCQYAYGDYVAKSFQCPASLVYDPHSGRCDWA